MTNPADYYRSARPEYFSDSTTVQDNSLERGYLEYQLDSITIRNQEADFERFARRICENTVCPNLKPPTGPVGGGDGKTDTETFPVAENLALSWFTGFEEGAFAERWAFAFSAMKRWKDKVHSDVKKIAETNRGYTRAFFVTNQAVSSRQQAKEQDDLKEKYGLEVTIFDRNWILDQVFSRQLETLAITELHIAGLAGSKLSTGPLDASRIANLEVLEKRIKDGLSQEFPSPSAVEDALEVADDMRSLEKSREEVKAAYVRADRLALKFGTLRQQVEAAYQWAWTLFMYLGDVTSFIEQYEVVEVRAVGSDNVYDLERLSNLWNLLCNHFIGHQLSAQDSEWFEERTRRLRDSLQRMGDDRDRPSASLQAQSLLVLMDLPEHFVSGTDPTPVFEAIRDIVPKIEHLIGFPFEPLVQVLTMLGEFVEDNSSYNSLFDEVIEAAAKRDGEIRAARLLKKRAIQLVKQDRPMKALAKAGQALLMLNKHETRTELGQALFLCAGMYERLGLLWAARGCYLRAASIALDQLSETSKPSAGLCLCIHKLKMLEVRLGRIPHMLAWNELDIPIRSNLIEQGMEFGYMEKDDNVFFVLSARLMMRTPWNMLPKVTSLPDTLTAFELDAAASALQYLIGDVKPLMELSDDQSVEEFANKIWNLRAEVPLPEEPSFYETESQEVLKTSVLGAKLSFRTSTDHPCIEVTEAILASVESLLATSAVERAFVYEPELTADVCQEENQRELISISDEVRMGRPHLVIRCKPVDPHNLSYDEQIEMGGLISEAAVRCFTLVARFRNIDSDLEAIFGEERAMDRAQFASSLSSLCNILGAQPKLRLLDWIRDDAITYPIVRAEAWQPLLQPSDDSSPYKVGRGDAPDELIDSSRLPHIQMAAMSPIRIRLWEQAKWKAVLFMWISDCAFPPVLALWFENAVEGKAIFENWIKGGELGSEYEKLRVTIIRGISQKNPSHYRVVIGVNLSAITPGMRLVQLGAQPITMTPDRSDNLDKFLHHYRLADDRTIFMPAITGSDGTPYPVESLGFPLKEIFVREAWEIGRHDPDGVGVYVDDDVIVPSDISNAPVLELLEWKKSFDQ